eukprot:366350-Chlamydomonas_euryale.AAC.17
MATAAIGRQRYAGHPTQRLRSERGPGPAWLVLCCWLSVMHVQACNPAAARARMRSPTSMRASEQLARAVQPAMAQGTPSYPANHGYPADQGHQQAGTVEPPREHPQGAPGRCQWWALEGLSIELTLGSDPVGWQSCYELEAAARRSAGVPVFDERERRPPGFDVGKRRPSRFDEGDRRSLWFHEGERRPPGFDEVDRRPPRFDESGVVASRFAVGRFGVLSQSCTQTSVDECGLLLPSPKQGGGGCCILFLGFFGRRV